MLTQKISFALVAGVLTVTAVRAQDAVRQPWKMHHIHDDFLFANSLSPGDLNGDGFTDYTVIDENAGIYSILLHPGKGKDPRQLWQRIIIGKNGNPEYSYPGDLDGDGNVDIVGLSGDDTGRGGASGIEIFWGPGKEKLADANAWTYSGFMPGSEGRQYVFVECRDINQDGAMDIVGGGRRHIINRSLAGIFWYEAPKNKADRRDLRKWTRHYIDEQTPSGHAFIFHDVDQDGDEDIVDANADWDTPDQDEELLWYENPGKASPAQGQPWKKYTVFRRREFYSKAQVGVGDVDKDGLTDMVVQIQNDVLLFLKKSVKPTVTWERINIPKPEITQWISRPTKLIDLNQDGRLDVVGMLIPLDGVLPKEKASVFWMEYEGDKPGKDNWKTHAIKWADGSNTRSHARGEKWDHCRFADVDGDGDMDIVANAEEHFENVDGKNKPIFAIIWFENPLK